MANINSAVHSAYLMMIPVTWLCYVLVIGIGLAVFAVYAEVERCDVVKAGIVQSSNEVSACASGCHLRYSEKSN